jgi:hypothetical protein
MLLSSPCRYGLLLWEVLHRLIPFGSTLCHIQVISSVMQKNARPPLGELPAGLAHLSPLIARCWHVRPAVRPEMREVLEELVRCGAELQLDLVAAAPEATPMPMAQAPQYL